MLHIIETLARAEAAYVVEGGSVFFRVHAIPTYGELSKLSRAQMLEIAGQQDDADVDDPRKEDPLDFALWKGWSGRSTSRAGTARGAAGGRAGTSSVRRCATSTLGAQLTIHGGGSDLVFPHHESEIAQSEKATRTRPFAQFWSHVAMVRMDGEKMSKSLGNMVFLRDLLRTYSADAIRLYLLGHHYRQVWEWAPADLDGRRDVRRRLARPPRA